MIPFIFSQTVNFRLARCFPTWISAPERLSGSCSGTWALEEHSGLSAAEALSSEPQKRDRQETIALTFSLWPCSSVKQWEWYQWTCFFIHSLNKHHFHTVYTPQGSYVSDVCRVSTKVMHVFLIWSVRMFLIRVMKNHTHLFLVMNQSEDDLALNYK